MKFMTFGHMADCGDPQELREFDAFDDALAYIREQEKTAHPDIGFWVEDANGRMCYSDMDSFDEQEAAFEEFADWVEALQREEREQAEEDQRLGQWHHDYYHG